MSDGELLLPAVQLFAQSAALARNATSGPDAEVYFALDMLRTLNFRVHLTVLSPDQPELGEREIVNTVTQGLNPLTALLETVLEEIAELYERKKGNPDGSQDH